MTNHHELTATLSAAGKLPAAWAEAFAAVDRAAFIPGRVWFDDEQGRPQPLDRDGDPDRWRAAVYSNEPIVIQLDDGATVWPSTSNAATSSASQPSMVLAMLNALNVHDGQRVLEIGTGTGYNAALLSQRLGDDQVTTIEVDPDLAKQARSALEDAGHKPTVVCGDGAMGYPARAPFDRIIVTAAVIAGQLPYAWVEQTHPQGQILTPWGTAYRNGVLVRLDVQDDGTAIGPVIGDAAFMRLRAQRTPFGHAARLGDLVDASTTAIDSTTTVPPGEAATGDGAFSIGLHLADVQCGVYYDSADTYEVLLYHVPTESAAAAQVNPDTAASGRYPVRQHGPRHLWEEVEAAHAWWVEHGRPARTRYGLTVTAEHQTVYLDDPANTITTLC